MMRTTTRWIPQGYQEVTREGIEAVVYIADTSALGYSGKRKNHDFHYRFKDTASRDNYVNAFFDTVKSRAQNKRINKVEILTEDYTGKIFHYSFGYDMTINVYAKCIKQTGKTLYLKECYRMVSGDDGRGEGKATTTGEINPQGEEFQTQKRGVYQNGVKKYEYFTGPGNHSWKIWDGKPNYHNTWD